MELVEGYGVYLTKRQLDEAVDQSCNSATRLMRNLLVVYFTPSVLASSSCGGTRRYPALNRDIIGACFSKLIVTLVELTILSLLLWVKKVVLHLGAVCSETASIDQEIIIVLYCYLDIVLPIGSMQYVIYYIHVACNIPE